MKWRTTNPAAPDRPVYVIDDDSSLGASVRFLLSTLKLSARTFKSGRDFLNQVDTLQPGVILLDLQMPEMNGFEVQAALKSRGIHWPVVIMTGEAEMPALAGALRREPVEFILKPFSDERLLGALHAGFQRLGECQGNAQASNRA
jgi:two-component system, LuxR family, response regulator FixJ